MPKHGGGEPTEERIMASAERLIRRRGYNGFSYRDIADEVGVRSASIHYHYPTKADLGAAVARRYTERFRQRLAVAEAEGAGAYALMQRYISLFREALDGDGGICLCGILGAEVAALPAPVAAETRRFFELNTAWLERLLAAAAAEGALAIPAPPAVEARLLFATLEGALIYARVSGSLDAFEAIASAALCRLCRP